MIYESERWRVERGDALALLKEVPDASVDALVTDPPYSSGGFTRGDRIQDPDFKYVQSGTELVRASFSGDNRDQRSFCYWLALVLSECRRVVKPGGRAMVFTDWRQLPMASDAFQAGGFVWRGVVAWDKGRGSRAPHTGYFRHQCEYVVWGSNGAMAKAPGGPWDGCLRETVRQGEKHHMTGKPPGVMRALLAPVPMGGLVLDPFCGSGTTGVACIQTGRRFLGFELSAHYVGVARKRLANVDAVVDVAAGDEYAEAGLFEDDESGDE